MACTIHTTFGTQIHVTDQTMAQVLTALRNKQWVVVKVAPATGAPYDVTVASDCIAAVAAA